MYKAIIDEDTYMSIFEVRHAAEIYELINDSRDYIRQWLAFPDQTHSVEDSEAFVRRSLTRFANNNGYWAGIWHMGHLAGSIGYLQMDWDSRRTEIGYWLGEQYEGKGIMTRACRLFVNHAFEQLDLRKIEIGAAVHNLKSRAIAERLGFVEEGTIRNYEKLNHIYLDRVIYGQLKDEWEKSNK